MGKDWNTTLQEANSNYNQKIVVDGSITYVALAPIGTAQSEAKWQVRKIDKSVTNTTTITWADSDDEFDNIATDLPSLTYG